MGGRASEGGIELLPGRPRPWLEWMNEWMTPETHWQSSVTWNPHIHTRHIFLSPRWPALLLFSCCLLISLLDFFCLTLEKVKQKKPPRGAEKVWELLYESNMRHTEQKCHSFIAILSIMETFNIMNMAPQRKSSWDHQIITFGFRCSTDSKCGIIKSTQKWRTN